MSTGSRLHEDSKFSSHISYGSAESSLHPLMNHTSLPLHIEQEEQEDIIIIQGDDKHRSKQESAVIFNTANALLGASMFSLP